MIMIQCNYNFYLVTLMLVFCFCFLEYMCEKENDQVQCLDSDQF